ncbi:mucoidy inhibitor MuiA family protein [Pelomyxa schiedti]|nr:mucoidy inhibitor MuiA family protein [Pelomyxa schiedti]
MRRFSRRTTPPPDSTSQATAVDDATSQQDSSADPDSSAAAAPSQTTTTTTTSSSGSNANANASSSSSAPAFFTSNLEEHKKRQKNRRRMLSKWGAVTGSRLLFDGGTLASESVVASPSAVPNTEHCGSAPVTCVVVYPSGADVTRRVTFKTSPGRHEVIVRDIPLCATNLRIAGVSPNCVIPAVSPFTEPRPDIPEIKIIQKRIAELDLELSVLSKRKELVKCWLYSLQLSFSAPPPNGNSPDTSGICPLIPQFVQMKAKLAESLAFEDLKLQSQKKEAEYEYKKLCELKRTSIASLQHARLSAVVVSDEEVSFDICYAIPSASWKPNYEIYVTPGQTSIHIVYYGELRQQSGEDWNNVKLALCTQASFSGSIPVLPRRTLSIYHPVYSSFASRGRKMYSECEKVCEEECYDLEEEEEISCSRSRSRSVERSRSGSTSSSASRSRSRHRTRRHNLRNPTTRRQPAAALKVLTSNVKGTDNSFANFEIPCPCSIESGASKHRVVITMLELPASFSYDVLIEGEHPKAYLSAFAQNSNFPLVPANGKVYFDNSFAFVYDMQFVNANEEFEMMLGVDDSIQVTKQPIQKYADKSGIIAKVDSLGMKYTTTIKNTRGHEVSLSVMQVVPNPTDSRLKLKIQQPRLTATKSGDPPEATLEDNVVAWSQVLPSRAEAEFVLHYCLEFPRDTVLSETLP